MNKYLATIFVAICLSLSALGQPEVTDSIRLTAVGAPWWVVIDGPDLGVETVRTKADGSYFLFYPTKEELNLSLYIEPAVKCKTGVECRDFVLNAGNPAWGEFEKLNKDNFGKFSYFEFYRPQVMGQPLQMQDMYAQYVDSGYWMDVHISKVHFKAEDKARFEGLLSSIRFMPKEEELAANEPIGKIVAAGNSWLLDIWDQQKCGESYRALTSISREAVEEPLWVEFCKSAHRGLGKLRSRELIAITTTKSLPQQPDKSGAVLRFQSIFENGPVIERMSFTSEKDGTWSVSNYFTQ
jgi:hypothetical protein